MSKVAYAIGDIHGMADKLSAMLDKIKVHAAEHFPGREKMIVFLGDYVDRGPDSKRVIDTVMELSIDEFEKVTLLGNHEDMLLDAIREGSSYSDFTYWSDNGGSETAKSYSGVISKSHVEWMKSLELYRIEGEFLFVHAGIRPGVPIVEQDKQVMIWIRDAFLNSDVDHGVVVVHGHTPSYGPTVRNNRIGIDTGAVFNRDLCCAVIDTAQGKSAKPEFILA